MWWPFEPEMTGKHEYQFFYSFQRRLSLLVLSVVVPALLLILYLAHEQYEREKAEALSETRHRAEAIAGETERIVGGARQVLAILSRLPAVVNNDPEACNAEFSAFHKQFPMYGDIVGIKPNGDVFYSAVPLVRKINLADRLYFRKAAKEMTFSLGEYHIGRITGKPGIASASPIIGPGGKFKGVIALSLDLEWLNKCVTAAELPRDSYITMFDRRGTILARYPDPEHWMGRNVSETVQAGDILKPDKSTAETVDTGSLDRVFPMASGRGTDNSVHFCVGVSNEAIYAHARQTFIRNGILLVAIALLASVAVWLGGNYFIRRPIKKIAVGADELSAGNLSVRVRAGGELKEIDQLAFSFNNMASALEKVNRALRTLINCNNALIHADSEKSFLEEICRIIVEDGKYLMAWIGYPQKDAEKTVLPVAYAGRDDGYLSAVKVSWEDNELGRGPTGTAIRTGELQVRNNRLDDPSLVPWREEAAKRGYASAIGLPLRHGKKCYGALTIFSTATNIFIEEENKLLQELAGNIAFGITTLRMRVKKRMADEQLKISNEQLRNLTIHLELIREEERTNLAREIHDELGQMLLALNMDLSWFRDKYGDHEPIFDKTVSMLHNLNTTIQSVKRICTELRPSLLDDFGLVAAIEWQLNEFQKRTGIECVFLTEPDEIQLDRERSTALFRIFQEALTNILKHADATKVTARLTQVNGSVFLEVHDNGKGIKKEQISKPKSFGLMEMRERAYPWGGKVDITGFDGKGTTVKISMPQADNMPKSPK